MKTKIAALAVCAVLSFPFDSQSAPILDQQAIPRVTLVAQARSIDYWGQTFTAGATGQLTRAELLIFRTPNVSSDLELYFFDVVANHMANPRKVVVPAASISSDPFGVSEPSYYLDKMLSINLSSLDIDVVAGQRYGIVMHSDIPFEKTGGANAQQINWFGGCENNVFVQCGNPATSDTYAGGGGIAFNTLDNASVFDRSDFDFVFRTYVDPKVVPEPGSLSLIAASLLALGWRRCNCADKAARVGIAAAKRIRYCSVPLR